MKVVQLVQTDRLEKQFILLIYIFKNSEKGEFSVCFVVFLSLSPPLPGFLMEHENRWKLCRIMA